MKKADVANLITSMSNIAVAIDKVKSAADEVEGDSLVITRTDRVVSFLAGSISFAMNATARLGLHHSHQTAKRCNALMAALAAHMQRGSVPRHAIGDLAGQCNQLAQILADELGARTVLILDMEGSTFLEAGAASFGPEVGAAFPASGSDIQDAGRCIAFELWTASVLHLMRACETAVKSLGKKYGLDEGKDWNNIIQELPKKLERAGGKSSPERTWATETGTHFNFIRDAFRNHAMHGDRHFGEDEARLIYVNTKAFMRQVAIKMIADKDWENGTLEIV